MVAVDYNTAYKTVTDHLIEYWEANAVNVVKASSPAPELRFTGVEDGNIPKTHFARFTMRPVLERQSTMRTQIADGSKPQRYTTQGTIILQVFAPRSVTAEEELRKLSNVGKKAFRGRSLDGCIWFRNVRINALDPEAAFLRKNVVAEFEYDEIG